MTVEVRLQYRKFDQRYMDIVAQGNEKLGRIIRGHEPGQPYRNDLPVTTLAFDRVTFPVAGVDMSVTNPDCEIPVWQRWNDYGIGLLLKGKGGTPAGRRSVLRTGKVGPVGWSPQSGARLRHGGAD